jgi:uncharacterized repeat protein (TIGR01451 family)
MKIPYPSTWKLLCVVLLLMINAGVHGQQSTNTIKYKLTYDLLTGKYTVFVVPDYSTPNSFNTGSNEEGATAQVTIKVPKDFDIQGSITNSKGVWGVSQKLNGSSYGLDPEFSYYIFNKAASVTDYGPFVQGTPVELFSFMGNGCFGQMGVLAKGDPFVAAAASSSLNVECSFYSKSGQSGNDSNSQGGGNQVPLEQFINKLGPDTECRSDLMLTKTVNNSQPNVGSNVIFTITVSNTGPGAATGVVVKDSLLSGYTFVSDDGATSSTYDDATGLWTIGTIAGGSSAILRITARVNATGDYRNYAQVFKSNDLDIDSSPGNGPQNPDEDDDDEVSTAPVPVADLSITKTDGSATYTPGTTTTYTIVVANAGPSDVVDARVTDNAPEGTTWSYTSTGTSGTSGYTASGTANINDLVAIPMGGSITYTVLTTIPAEQTGELVNTAVVSAPNGTTDLNLSNNIATDRNTRNSRTDLSITKTDGLAKYTPGTTTTYTIVVNNAGPSNVVGATVTDQAPTGTTITSWSAIFTGGATGTGSGTGNINQSLNLPSGSTATYTVVLSVPSGYTGNLANTASVLAPAGVTDTNLANNSATDTDTQDSKADLIVTKTDNSPTYTPGTTTTYTVVVSNTGPSNVVNATVTDTAPAGTTITGWTAMFAGGSAGTAAGSGNINQIVSIPRNGSITYTVTVAIPSGFTGDLVNTASVAAPNGVTETDLTNNSATDTNTQNSKADLIVTKTDNSPNYTPGTTTTYTVVVSNAGPSNVVGASVKDTIPTGTTWSYTSTGMAGTGGHTPNGTGNINDLVNLPAGTSITYTVAVAIPHLRTGNLVNTARIAAPDGVTDDTPGNNTATDTDIQDSVADLAVVKSVSVPRPESDAEVTFSLLVTNYGPSAATGVTVTDLLPSGYTYVSDNGSGAYNSATGQWSIGSLVNGGTASLNIVATINSTGEYENTATVSSNQTDPVPGNNQSKAGIEKQLVLPKVYLQGALFGVTYSDAPTNTTVNTLMRDDLRTKELIPTTSPYGSWLPTVLDSIINPSVLAVTGANAIVDWVFVELRSASDPTVVISSRSALLQRDGDVVNLDGTSPLDYRAQSGAGYYLVVRHRNHLAVMTAGAISFTPSGVVVDFRQSATPTYLKGATSINKAQVDVLQGRAMWAGNALHDNQVGYQGTGNDVNVVAQQVVNAPLNTNKLSFYISKGYFTGDINLNGEVIFQGTGNDVEFIYQNVIKNHPGNAQKDNFFIIQEQLPN